MRVLIALIFLSISFSANAQTISVGKIGLEDYYRRQQLLGNIDSNVSFTVRPIYPKVKFNKEDVFFTADEDVNFKSIDQASFFSTANSKWKVNLLPLEFKTQINSHHPYGMNDGPMIPNKGIQAYLSGGFSAEIGMLSIQLNPEFVVASNNAFDEFNKDHYDVVTARYYDFYNNIDLPTRFGTKAYAKAFIGQSSIRLNHKSISVGLSTENLWWGPALRNSLLMSNNAPGFAHLTLNTIKPINTKFGSLEGQIIAGRLKGSGYAPLAEDRFYFNSNLYVPKSEDWRYLTGFVFTYQPKWVPGLFLGLTQTKQLYSKDLNEIGDYLPFLSSNKNTVAQANNLPDQRYSYFLRWLWSKEQAEFYIEYGKNNYRETARENALRPETSRGYTVGVRKLMPFGSRNKENLMIGVEVSQLQETKPELIAQGRSWYLNKYIRQGYTHLGEVIGAGIGPGGNVQSLDVSWVKGLKRLGLQFERYVHNNDLYYYIFTESQDFRRHWVDLSIGAHGDWNYKNFIFNAKVQAIKSLNYQWYLSQNQNQSYMVKGLDAFNFNVQLGLSYRF